MQCRGLVCVSVRNSPDRGTHVRGCVSEERRVDLCSVLPAQTPQQVLEHAADRELGREPGRRHPEHEGVQLAVTSLGFWIVPSVRATLQARRDSVRRRPLRLRTSLCRPARVRRFADTGVSYPLVACHRIRFSTSSSTSSATERSIRAESSASRSAAPLSAERFGLNSSSLIWFCFAA